MSISLHFVTNLQTGMVQMKLIMWFTIIAELVIIDDDDKIWTQRISSLTHTNAQDESYEGASQKQEILCGIGFGPKILDTIADRVVDKIVFDGGSAGAKPKYNVKEEQKKKIHKRWNVWHQEYVCLWCRTYCPVTWIYIEYTPNAET